MRSFGRNLTTIAFTLAAISSASCNAAGISHPISDDGSCNGLAASACQTNHNTTTLTLSADHTLLKVGQGVAISPMYNGQVLQTNVSLPATLTDSSVISGSAFSAFGLAVGQSTINVTYGGAQASISFGVEPSDDGLSAEVGATVYAGNAGTIWLPMAPKVSAGSTVQFRTKDSVGQNHDIVFDAVAGAPANVVAGALVTRVFATAGTFPYHCSLHGEQGMVTVTP